MAGDSRFDEAIRRIDEANGEDPRTEMVGDQPQPKELLFARRVSAWIPRLMDNPSEALLLAARGHTVRRWRIPRDTYSKDNIGYHEWREALARFHADQTVSILKEVGYDAETIERVRGLITRAYFPGDSEAEALEDADCLVFLETKLADYLDDWEEEKTVNILRKTIKKMTPKGVSLVSGLSLSDRCVALVAKAMR